MTLELLAAQCFVFLAAGFETSSSVLSYAFYELALSPDIQRTAQKEIDDKIEEHGTLTYGCVQEMTYLDQIMNESLRKYPTLPILQRKCVRSYKFPGTNDVIDEGTRVIIPTYALHHDPKYYPNPNKFDPGRFNQENKGTIPDYAFLPFGEGPRNCIGMRFGQIQVKVGLAAVLSKFNVETCVKTAVPLKFLPTLTVTTTDGPIYLKFVNRD